MKRGPKWQPCRAERNYYASRFILGARRDGWTREEALELAAAEFGEWPGRRRQLSASAFRKVYRELAHNDEAGEHAIVAAPVDEVKAIAERHAFTFRKRYQRRR